jgi:hypothetical protein
MTPSRSQIQITIGIAVVVWAALLLVQGVTLKANYLRPYSLAVSAAVLALLIFDRWLWRLAPIQRLVKRPLLHGTWRGELLSSWTDPKTGKGVDPIVTYVAFKQTYSGISMRLMTKESSSRSLVAALDNSNDQLPLLTSTYVNTPQLLIQGRSRIHHGAVMLDVHGNPPDRLTGTYWTDRDTKGQLNLSARTRALYTSFEEAANANWPDANFEYLESD